MLNAYARPNMAIKELLNPTDDSKDNTLQKQLVKRLTDEDDPGFTESRQKQFDGIAKKGGANQ